MRHGAAVSARFAFNEHIQGDHDNYFITTTTMTMRERARKSIIVHHSSQCSSMRSIHRVHFSTFDLRKTPEPHDDDDDDGGGGGGECETSQRHGVPVRFADEMRSHNVPDTTTNFLLSPQFGELTHISGCERFEEGSASPCSSSLPNVQTISAMR